MAYKDVVKFGFYEFQSARDWYREVTSDVGMHRDLVRYWINAAALIIAPIAPYFAEHIHSAILKSPTSIQLALWPTPAKPVDRTTLEAVVYMRDTIKTIRDAEISPLKMLQKAKGKKGLGGPVTAFDPKLPKSVQIYVAMTFPEWQDACVQAVKDAYDEQTDKVDDER